MALAPLVVAAWRRPERAFWWLAAAFTVSWLADLAARLGLDPWVVGLAYPVSQSALIGAVLLSRREAWAFLGVLVVAAIAALWLRGVEGPDVALRTAAWLGLVGIVWDRRALGMVRTALLVAFGLGWVAWCAYAIVPGWWTWGAYQMVRAAGIALVCRAIWWPVRLRLSPTLSHVEPQRQR